MSKKRAATKYTAAGAVSLVYLAAAYRLLTAPPKDDNPVSNEQAAIAGAALLGLTWTATLL